MENELAPAKTIQSDKYGILDRFFALSLDMLLIVDLDGKIQQANPACSQTLYFAKEEFISRSLLEFVVPEYRESTFSQLQKLGAEIDRISWENCCRCQDGSFKWLSWNATLSPEEKLIYLVGRDISAQKQEKEAQQTTEESFPLLVESVKDYAIYMLDPNGLVISWNAGAERIKKYSSQEIIGRHFSCFYPSEAIKSGQPDRELKIAATEGRFEDEGWRVRKDGSRFWVNAIVTALRDKNGQLRGFAKVTRDITERKIAQEALQQAHDNLEKRVAARTAELTQANELLKQEIVVRKRTETALRQSKSRLKDQATELEKTLRELQRTQAQLIQNEKMSSLGQLVAGIAHEINNPTSFIYCNLDYAHRYIQDLLHLLRLYQQNYPHPVSEIKEAAEAIDLDFLIADIAKILSSMKLGAKRIQQIVLSLRNFARHDEAEMKFVNIHEGIDSTISLLQNRLKANDKHSGIQAIQAYGDLPLVECYPGLLNQVFMNLLSNSIDALESDRDTPTIIIRTEMKPDLVSGASYISISIADNGPGIAESVHHKLFDPFFTTKPVGQGIGLGLSICYQIVVQKHGGKLTCISEPGKGAEFIVEIPIVQQRKEKSFPSQSQSTIDSSAQQSLVLG